MEKNLNKFAINSYIYILISYLLYIPLHKIEKYILSNITLLFFYFNNIQFLFYIKNSESKYYFLNFCTILINSIIFIPIIFSINIQLELLKILFIIIMITIIIFSIYLTFQSNISLIKKILSIIIFDIFIIEFLSIIYFKTFGYFSIKILFCLSSISFFLTIKINHAFNMTKNFFLKNDNINMNEHILIFIFLFNANTIYNFYYIILEAFNDRHYCFNDRVTVYNNQYITHILESKKKVPSKKKQMIEKSCESKNNNNKKITQRKNKSDDIK